MKKLLLFTVSLMVGISLMAQFRPVHPSGSLQNLRMLKSAAIDNQVVATQPGNQTVNSKSALDDVVGASRYDMQSNGAIQNGRVTLWPDGNVSAAWTMGLADPSYADRGTGYNYRNGTTWGAAPTARIETMKCGWPSVNIGIGGSELLISHNSTVNLVMNTRPVKGTGSWTQSLITPAPTGATGLIWPRVVTNGANHQNIHIIVVTTPTANGGTAYQGLDGALIYYRSLDGGATWDKPGIILPGLTSADNLGFTGDSYAWAPPKGDSLAFVYGDDWSDTFLMQSFDNGNTWTKKIIVPNYYKMIASGTATPSFPSCDGTSSCAFDKNGVVHVAFGRMRAQGATTGRLYFPYTDGLVYWNSTMPAIDTTILTDIDSLYAHNLLIGYVESNAAGDTIVAFPKYYTSLSAFPQIVIDNFNNKYFLWSGLTVGNPSPDPYNYRHIWARAWFHDKAAWSDMVDLNSSILYMFQEYAYPACATKTKNDKILLLTQTSSQPGANIKDTSIPIHDVNMEYREVPVTDLIAVGVDKTAATPVASVSQNFPNPAKGITTFRVVLGKSAKVTVDVKNVMGQSVMNFDKGFAAAGVQTYNLDVTSLSAGIYFYTVRVNGESFTHKMIVE